MSVSHVVRLYYQKAEEVRQVNMLFDLCASRAWQSSDLCVLAGVCVLVLATQLVCIRCYHEQEMS